MPHDQRSLTTSAATAGRQQRRRVGAVRRCRGALAGAQLRRAGARIARDLFVVGDDRPLGQHREGRRRAPDVGRMARAAARFADAIGEEALDDAVFQRMERDDDQPAARLEHALGGGERLGQLVELVD